MSLSIFEETESGLRLSALSAQFSSEPSAPFDSGGLGEISSQLGESGQIIGRRHLSDDDGSEWFDVVAQTLSSALLFILIFGMSATVEVQHLREQVHNKFAILTGVATQFIIMPLLGYVSITLLKNNGLTEPMAISLLIVTASPGGSYSNWWCSMFNADLALSVTMTAISTLVSSIMLPANLLLYVNAAFGFGSRKEDNGEGSGGNVLSNIDWASLFVSLAIVIAAIGLGLCASFKISSHRFNRLANRLGSFSGVLLIVFSAVLTSLSGDTEAQVWGQPWSFYVGVTFPCLVGLSFATFFAVFAKLKKPEVVSVGVECCYQNVGIATSAAVAMFDDPLDRGQALCVPLFYGVMEAVVLGLYCIVAWKFGWTKAPKNEKFLITLMTTYEVEDDDIEEGFEDEQKDEEQIRERPHTEETDSIVVLQVEQMSAAADSRKSENWSNESLSAGNPDWDTWSWPFLLNLFGGSKLNDDDILQHNDSPEGGGLSQMKPEAVDAISEDNFGSPGSLVSFRDEGGEYARCRINSEDSAGGTATTSAMTESACTAATNAKDRPLSNSLMIGTF